MDGYMVLHSSHHLDLISFTHSVSSSVCYLYLPLHICVGVQCCTKALSYPLFCRYIFLGKEKIGAVIY